MRQTRLRTHQDAAAVAIMDDYEQWYKDNGIEALLVERMRAKQLKEAAKTRRTRGATPLTSSLKTKRETKHIASSTTVKPEPAFPPDFPLVSGFSTTENDCEIHDDFFAGNDMLSLKGQIWPGMGKMDLANEDMKRTRNQRKPNSFIEKMRKISEGIEPMQVVMTPDLEVERVKGVYDSSSPIPGQEEETLKKVLRPKRKRSAALAELSVNVPRGGNRRQGRNNLAKPNRVPQLKLNCDCNPHCDEISCLSAFGHGHGFFPDDEGSGMLFVPALDPYLMEVGIFECRSFACDTHTSKPKFQPGMNRESDLDSKVKARFLVRMRYRLLPRMEIYPHTFCLRENPSREETNPTDILAMAGILHLIRSVPRVPLVSTTRTCTTVRPGFLSILTLTLVPRSRTLFALLSSIKPFPSMESTLL